MGKGLIDLEQAKKMKMIGVEALLGLLVAKGLITVEEAEAFDEIAEDLYLKKIGEKTNYEEWSDFMMAKVLNQMICPECKGDGNKVLQPGISVICSRCHGQGRIYLPKDNL